MSDLLLLGYSELFCIEDLLLVVSQVRLKNSSEEAAYSPEGYEEASVAGFQEQSY